jgi:hypothetical protein
MTGGDDSPSQAIKILAVATWAVAGVAWAYVVWAVRELRRS